MNDEILIIIPSYNPPENLFEGLLNKLKDGFKNVLIINDGSNAKYNNFFKNAENKYKYKVLKNDNNLGKGSAIKKGYNYALENYPNVKVYVVIDCDNQHDIDDMIKCCQKSIKNPNSLVIGARNFDLENVPFRNKCGNILTRNVFKWLFNYHLNDVQTGLRAISPQVAKKLVTVVGNRYNYELNCLIYCCENGIPIYEVPIKTIYIGSNKYSHFNPIKDSIIIYKEFVNYYFKFIIPYIVSLIIFLVIFYCWDSTNDLFAICFTNAISGFILMILHFLFNYKNIYKHGRVGDNIIYILRKVLKIIIAGILIYILYNILNINLLFSKLIIDSILTFIMWSLFQKLMSKKN